jgi:glc operon protein GlcG
MRTKPILTAADCRLMISAARAEAEQQKWAVTIVVVDDGGSLLGLERLDTAFPQSAEIAIHKARTAAVMRFATKTLEDMVKDRPALVTMPGVTRVQGGLPIRVGSDWVGGIGVSGATSQQDEQVAAAGIAALLAHVEGSSAT